MTSWHRDTGTGKYTVHGLAAQTQTRPRYNAAVNWSCSHWKRAQSSGKRPQPPPRRHSQAAPESAELERRCHGPSPSPSAARLPGQRMPRPGGFTRGPSAGRIAAVTPTRHGSSTVCVLHGLGPGCGTGCNGSRTVILTQITRRLKIECQEDENLKCWLCGRR